MYETEITSKIHDRRSAASRLGISVITLDRERARRRIGYIQIGRRVLFTEAQIAEYLASRSIGTARR